MFDYCQPVFGHCFPSLAAEEIIEVGQYITTTLPPNLITVLSSFRKECKEKVETCTNTAYGVVPVRMVPVREEPEYEVVGLPQMSS